jgi:hypothetical protein
MLETDPNYGKSIKVEKILPQSFKDTNFKFPAGVTPADLQAELRSYASGKTFAELLKCELPHPVTYEHDAKGDVIVDKETGRPKGLQTIHSLGTNLCMDADLQNFPQEVKTAIETDPAIFKRYMVSRAIMRATSNYIAATESKTSLGKDEFDKEKTIDFITLQNKLLASPEYELLPTPLHPESDSVVPSLPEPVAKSLAEEVLQLFGDRTLTSMQKHSGAKIFEENILDDDVLKVIKKTDGAAIVDGLTTEAALERRLKYINEEALPESLQEIRFEADNSRRDSDFAVKGELSKIDAQNMLTSLLEGGTQVVKGLEDHGKSSEEMNFFS